jgi:hypothetical protein
MPATSAVGCGSGVAWRLHCRVVRLEPLFDNDGISSRSRPNDGAFNLWGNTFPRESLPPGGEIVYVEGVPFLFPPSADGDLNNLRCRGQLVRLPRMVCDWIYVLGAAERRTEDELVLVHADRGERRGWLRISDFWAETPGRFGDVEAFRCDGLHYPRHVQRNMAPTIWSQRAPVAERAPLVALRLPDNPAIHLFALTLVREPPTEERPA